MTRCEHPFTTFLLYHDACFYYCVSSAAERHAAEPQRGARAKRARSAVGSSRGLGLRPMTNLTLSRTTANSPPHSHPTPAPLPADAGGTAPSPANPRRAPTPRSRAEPAHSTHQPGLAAAPCQSPPNRLILRSTTRRPALIRATPLPCPRAATTSPPRRPIRFDLQCSRPAPAAPPGDPPFRCPTDRCPLLRRPRRRWPSSRLIPSLPDYQTRGDALHPLACPPAKQPGPLTARSPRPSDRRGHATTRWPMPSHSPTIAGRPYQSSPGWRRA